MDFCGNDYRDDKCPTVFNGNGISVKCELFDEWYFSYNDMSVNHVVTGNEMYTIGDSIPLGGNSYKYPGYFDVLILQKDVAIKIRHGLVEDIVPIDEYEYLGLPVVNGRGFELMIKSDEDLRLFQTDCKVLEDINEITVLNRWLRFGSFHHVCFGNSSSAIDYII